VGGLKTQRFRAFIMLYKPFKILNNILKVEIASFRSWEGWEGWEGWRYWGAGGVTDSVAVLCCSGVGSPDFDNPPAPPIPPMTKRALFTLYNILNEFKAIINIIKEYKVVEKSRSRLMGGLWEG
jgi:hypothetical protein